jgi:hypothetical protein
MRGTESLARRDGGRATPENDRFHGARSKNRPGPDKPGHDANGGANGFDRLWAAAVNQDTGEAGRQQSEGRRLRHGGGDNLTGVAIPAGAGADGLLSPGWPRIRPIGC